MLLDEAKTGYTHQCWFNALSTNIQNHAVGLITEFMPYTYTVEIGDGTQIGVVHAHPPLRGWALDWQNREQQEIDVFLWRRVRRGAVPTQIIGADGVVFGHNNVPEVTKFGSSICIDTLMETGRLSILEAREVLHAIKSTD